MTETPSLTAPQTRPIGITVLAVLALIGAVFGVLGALVVFAASAVLAAFLGPLAAFGAVAAILLLAYAAFAAAVSYGLFKRLRWAWYASLVMAGLQLLMGLLALLSFDLVTVVVDVAIGGVIGWYLLTPPIQAWFGVKHDVPWNSTLSSA